MNIEKINELMSRDEPLIDELVPYVDKSTFGTIIHHPLLIELFFDPRKSALVNERYRHKKKLREEYLAQKKWDSYIFLHERPYRIQALQRAMSYGPTNAADLVRTWWVDSENIWQNKRAWRSIWSQLGSPRDVMDANERTVFEWMPETVTIHRGVRHRTHWPKGMSWTRDKERAVWFAHRHSASGQVPTVLSAEVPKSRILAFINARSEEEVVVLPRYVRVTQVDERRKS